VNKSILSTIALSVVATAPMTALAADVHTQPQVDFRAEYNDNFGLAPDGGEDSGEFGYVADLEALIGIATPRSQTAVRPRVKLQEFPDRDDLERVEGFFDVASDFRGQRGSSHLQLGYERRDIYSTETPSGGFDPVDPGGDDPEAGPIVVGETRTKFDIEPSFDYRVTERMSIGAGVYLNSTRYDADGETTKTDYDYGVARGSLTWALSPSSDFTLGAYTSRYEADDDSEEIDAIGGLIGYAYRWSEQSGIEASVFHEENDITEFVPVRVEESESNVGGQLSAYRLLEVSSWRFSISRSFIPTGDGGKSEYDQFRIQYVRKLSERLGFTGVARYDSRNGLGGTETGLDKDYARVDLALKWNMTPTWYIGGGYSYLWVDREQAIDSADNNKLFLNVGYRGLARTQGRSSLLSEEPPRL
jgi:hypothetical protein